MGGHKIGTALPSPPSDPGDSIVVAAGSSSISRAAL